jgi:DNA-binding helix-hairpin-helix protein with protein kinase domain
VEWNLKNELKEAFYIENDLYFKNVIQGDYDYVFSPRYGYLFVEGKPIYSGGEGDVYATYKNLMVKLYYSKHVNYQNYLKLKAMTDNPVENPYIVWPLDIVYNEDNQFVGYVMREVKNSDSMDDLRDIGFQPYNPIERIQIGINFLKNVRYLHEKNILVGDMKFDNILVRNPQEVYLIDTGSFQVEDYPCTVFNLEFTDTSISESNLKKTLRDPDSEYFPINKILFELLILKSPFYSKDNIEIDPTSEREFHYEIDPPKFRTDPPKHLKLWFSLSLTLRQYFYYYFKEKKVTYLNEIIEELERFKFSLTSKGDTK